MTVENNLIFIFVSSVAGQGSWVTEEPTWSEYIQTGVIFFLSDWFNSVFYLADSCIAWGVLFETLMVFFAGMVRGGNYS